MPKIGSQKEKLNTRALTLNRRLNRLLLLPGIYTLRPKSTLKETESTAKCFQWPKMDSQIWKRRESDDNQKSFFVLYSIFLCPYKKKNSFFLFSLKVDDVLTFKKKSDDKFGQNWDLRIRARMANSTQNDKLGSEWQIHYNFFSEWQIQPWMITQPRITIKPRACLEPSMTNLAPNDKLIP